jgi:hypothetical protein
MTGNNWDEDFQRFWDLTQKMTDAQREDLLEVLELTASRPDGGSILDGLTATRKYKASDVLLWAGPSR